MDHERWTQLKRIVAGALDLEAEARTTFLDEECGEDIELHREAEALLAVSTSEAEAYEDVCIEPSSLRDVRLKERDELGPYQVKREIATGGMSRVYLAKDTRNDRDVAIKFLRPRAARLAQAEQKILARLTHSNIATLYDSGRTGDEHEYLVMEYVDGLPITDYCHEQNLTLRPRRELFGKVCGAVQYAHQNLVVHRDLKPSNIFVTADGVPKLLDFGIAKELPTDREAATVTAASERPMTFAFASPEQVDGEPTAIATDVSSLGVLLCLLLTGRLPYRVKSLHDLPWAIRNLDAQSLSTLIDDPIDAPATFAHIPQDAGKLSKLLRGDLDAIALKALHKQPGDRYASVEQLSQDIQRYLGDQPVEARRGSRRYVAMKFLRRYRVGVSVIAAATLLLSGFTLVLTDSLKQTREQRDLVRHELERGNELTDFLIRIFEVSDPWKQKPEDLTAKDLLNRAASRIEGDLANNPDRQAALLSLLSDIYRKTGFLQEALPLSERALQIRKQNFTSSDPQVTDAKRQLAIVNYSLGNYQEARTLQEENVQLAQETYGGASLETAFALSDLAKTHWVLREYEEAELAYRDALTIQRNLLGNDSTDTAETIYNLAVLLKNTADYDEALKLHKESLSIKRRLLERDHPSIAFSLNGIAALLSETGSFEEAEARYRESIAMKKRLFNEGHPSTAKGMNNLAVLLEKRGKITEAEALHREALAIRQGLYPDGHRETAFSLQNLAKILDQQEKTEEAEELTSTALGMLERLFDSDHLSVAHPLSGLSVLVSKRGAFKEAEQLARRSLRIRRKHLGNEHPLVAVSMSNHARSLLELGKTSESLGLYRNVLSIREQVFGPDHPTVGFTLAKIARVQAKLGEFQQSDQTYVNARKALTRAKQNDGILYAVTLLDHADTLLELERPDEAKEILAEAKGISDRKYPDHKALDASYAGVHGKYLTYAGKYEKAEKYLQRSREILLIDDQPIGLAGCKALERSITLYDLWGKTRRAAEYRKQAASCSPE